MNEKSSETWKLKAMRGEKIYIPLLSYILMNRMRKIQAKNK